MSRTRKFAVGDKAQVGNKIGKVVEVSHEGQGILLEVAEPYSRDWFPTAGARKVRS